MAKRKHRAVMRYRSRVITSSAVLAVVVLCLLISVNGTLKLPFLPTWDSLFTAVGLQSGIPPEGEFRVTVLDVGNADCILLQSGDKAALIDAGENDDEERIINTLKNAHVKKLDYVIATHADADHIGSMETVIREFPIDAFIMSFMPEGYTPTTVTYERMLQAMAECDVAPIQAEFGDVYTLGDATITILSGISDHTETNDQSVVCRVSHGDMDFLFMGDAGKDVEREILKAVPNLDVEVLKVGHHGSRYSTDNEFLRAVSPDMAVITCGRNNSYHHPHSEVMTLLRRNNVTIYRSDVNGKIVMTSDGTAITTELEQERGG